MAIFNYKKREISAKIVYYGPALCGKTTNVQYIHKKLNPRQRGELVSLATDADRTLFFDFLPIELENVAGFKTRFQIYTVPGQVYYNSTRKAVLTGVDGVIFVADSQTSMAAENQESFNNLIENLKYYNRNVNELPLILQYNKRDLDNIMPVAELDQLLNASRIPSFTASALTGEGVLQALTACCKLVLQDLKNKSTRTEQESVLPKRPPTTEPQLSERSESRRPTAAPDSSTKTVEIKPSPVLEDSTLPPAFESTSYQEEPPVAENQLLAGEEDYKPEISQIGKPRQLDPYTVTLPLRLALNAQKSDIVTVDITFNISDFRRQ